MSEYYPVVKVLPEWRDEDEDMGSREKFWYRESVDGTPWLFKCPRENTGEHWAEKIAAEVAGLVGIPHARVELAEVEETPGGRGTVSESFLEPGSRLVHGNELMAFVWSEYNQDLRFRQSQHTLENILDILNTPMEFRDRDNQLARGFCEYLVLDALIGNTDRHHENWGLQPVGIQGGFRLDLAPTFDHASSLGRELTDERREEILGQEGMGRYSERGRGGIYWSDADRYGPSPLHLVRLSARQYPHMFTSALRRVESVELNALEDAVTRVPPGWMSQRSREFAVALMDYNWNQLNILLRDVVE